MAKPLISLPEAEEWLRRAKRYLRMSATPLEAGFADGASFHAQQAAEFALKAVQIHVQERFERTHDLAKLSKDIAAPPRIVRLSALLSPAYISSRYPDIGGIRITRRKGETYLDAARRIVRWARRQID